MKTKPNKKLFKKQIVVYLDIKTSVLLICLCLLILSEMSVRKHLKRKTMWPNLKQETLCLASWLPMLGLSKLLTRWCVHSLLFNKKKEMYIHIVLLFASKNITFKSPNFRFFLSKCMCQGMFLENILNKRKELDKVWLKIPALICCIV